MKNQSKLSELFNQVNTIQKEFPLESFSFYLSRAIPIAEMLNINLDELKFECLRCGGERISGYEYCSPCMIQVESGFIGRPYLVTIKTIAKKSK